MTMLDTFPTPETRFAPVGLCEAIDAIGTSREVDILDDLSEMQVGKNERGAYTYVCPVVTCAARCAIRSLADIHALEPNSSTGTKSCPKSAL